MRVSFQCFLPKMGHPVDWECKVAWEGTKSLCWFSWLQKNPKLAWHTGSFWCDSIRLFQFHPVLSSSRQDRPFHWLQALVHAVFSAWNAFPWLRYLVRSCWYFIPFCVSVRDWHNFGSRFRQVYSILWNTFWVIFLLLIFLTLIFNSLRFSLSLAFCVISVLYLKSFFMSFWVYNWG